MATKENILEQFAMFNINPSDAILQKCVELCQKYNMDEEAFVEQWFAFTTSNLKGAPPTIEYLERLERKELVHNKNQDNSIMQVDMSDAMDMDISSPPSRFPTGDNAPKTPQGHLPPVSQIINTPFQAKKDHKGVDILGSSLVNSPSVESHPNNTNREEPLSVRFYYGVKNAKFKREGDLPLTIRPVYENCMKSNQEFMLEHLGKRLDCMDHMMEDLAQAIINTRKLYKKGTQESNLDPDEVMLYGRVVSDSKKRIDKNRILVSQGGKFRGQFVLLDLSKLSEFSVFPGQVVVAYGLLKNATGDLATLEVKEFHAKAELALPDESPLVSVATCKDTFKSIREKYLREREKAQNNQYCRWELLDDLKFLDPHIVTRSASGTTPSYASFGDFSAEEDEQSLNSENDPLEFDRQLIRLVRKANAIWDRNLHYPNKDSKSQLWHRISTALQKDPNSCMLRWKALREKYIRQKAKFHEQGEGNNNNNKWDLLDDLSFLDKVIQYRRKQSELYPQQPGSSYIHCNMEEDSYDQNYTDTSNDFLSIVKEETMPDSSYGCKRARSASRESYVEEKRPKVEEQSHQGRTPEQLFGDLVASLLMKKPESQRNMYMIQVMTVLSK